MQGTQGGVNFLGQYAFTSLMLPQLLAANK